MAERDSLRHELADHHVQVGDDQQREDDGEEPGHQRLELPGERLLAERTDREAGQRDTELHRRDEARWVARDAQHEPRAAVALVLELHDPRPARRDEAVLGRDEERVQEQQPDQGQHLQREAHLVRPRRRARTGRQVVVHANQSGEYSQAGDGANACSYTAGMRVDYREEPCKVALNRVKGMPFGWSLNPYMGCVHRCTFCYVRAFERRADRPSDDRYGRSIRVKVNIAELLRAELARRSWDGGGIAIGAATDPYQPAEGRYRLTRSCLEVLCRASNPFSIITRGPLIVRDVDVLAEASRRADVSVTFSVPTVDDDVWRTTEPGTAPPR